MKDLITLKQAMDSCEQTSGLSVYEHGASVVKYFMDLYTHMHCGVDLELEWRMPDWLRRDLIDRLLPLNTLTTYQLWHDCGKPFCRELDADGRVHFPNHAQVSCDVWLEHGGDETTARLMAMDMDIHILKAEGVPEFASRPEAISLLLTGLAEIHSNAAMFGGIESTSFKMKWKQIDRRGRAVLKLLEL